MEIIHGGYSGVIFADNAQFANFTELKKLLKRGTSITPSTVPEDGSNNNPLSALKRVFMSLTSADYDPTIYDALKAAEEARTPLYFRFFPLSPSYYFDLSAVKIICQREVNEFGKFNAINVFGLGAGVTEAAIMNLVNLFNVFNPENV